MESPLKITVWLFEGISTKVRHYNSFDQPRILISCFFVPCMFWEYGAYLAFTLLGAFLLARWQAISFDGKAILLAKTLLATALIFVLWDVWAVFQGHWSFNPEFVLGFFLLNQPVEEVAFFLVIPFFYIVIWEILKKKSGVTA